MASAGAKYMKKGLSAISAFCVRTHSIAWSVMSSVRWYPSSGVFGGSTGAVPS